MKALLACGTGAVALALAGCAASATSPTTAGLNPTVAVATSSRCATPWIPHPKAIRCKASLAPSSMKSSSGALLYISDIGAETVDVFSYPAGKAVGKLTGFKEPAGLCSDSKGDVFVADSYAREVLEYAHGGTKPIAKLVAGLDPVSCAVDPSSGDLAVTNWTDPDAQGYLEVFKNASGSPTKIDALYRTFYCTYDGSGNLWIDGFNSMGTAGLGEVAAGTSNFTLLNFPGGMGWPGGMAWDGKQLVAGDQYASKYDPSRPPNALYQVAIVSGQGQIEKVIPLNGGIDIVQAWLQGKTVIGPDASAGDVVFYKYPAGGNATKTITGFDEPMGATVSE